MQAAWLLGALVVPQLLGFSHGARGAEREWEGGWGGAQEEEREREALMLKHLQEALGLPAGRRDKNPEGIPEGKGARATEKDSQGEEGEEEAVTTPYSSPSPSPTPEDTVTYIRDAAPHPLSPNQPNGGALENCVAQASDDGSWWDHECERRLYYVCEYPF
ncbi:hypothetical protein CB1_000153019 [Camelus ferus]|nr:hypothetical protein CB1_000153019 [Camelus ferus]